MSNERDVKVSVIVPVYNTAQYLNRCLESLVHQTLKEIEIIVINDGSTDHSQEIIDHFSSQHSDKIRAFTKLNGGLSDARNYGIQRASGQYIGFVDSDDFAEVEMFERLYEKAVESGAEVVCCPFSKVDENKSLVVKSHFATTECFGKNVRDDPRVLLFAHSYAWNKIYKRNLWTGHALSFPTGQWFEDSHVTYNILLVANKVECVNQPLYNYLKSREGAITTLADERIFDVFASCDSIIGFYRQAKAFDRTRAVLERVCLRHILPRLNVLNYQSDYRLSDRYIDKLYEYMDTNFPAWRRRRHLHKSLSIIFSRRLETQFVRSRMLFKAYVSSRPILLYVKRSQVFKTSEVTVKRILMPVSRLKRDARKRQAIQQDGLNILVKAQNALRNAGIVNFADFGTLLGLVREGRLLEHDVDVDVGVLLGLKNTQFVRVLLEREGFLLSRQYLYGNRVVEESYQYKGVRVDFNYYHLTAEQSKTWLFYRKPDTSYAGTERHVVEMSYSPIRGTRMIEVQGHQIEIPESAELLLEEKYGEKWRKPDKQWIYWLSPAARQVEEMGRFIRFKYENVPAYEL